jgi:Flp pilus assembly secretin CpaC
MKSRYIQWFGLLAFSLSMIMTVANAQVRSGDKNSVKRLYVNISETEKIAVPKVIDDYMTSFAGVAKITQTSDKVLLIEAVRAGKTTITIICGDDIYRYHLTTFEGRGAEEAYVNNEFADRGYIHLTARFDKVNKDQLLIEGKAETQAQLNDALEIAKQYNPYVILKAKVISAEGEVDIDDSSPEEREIEKTIEKIANIPGLRAKVKFEMKQKELKVTETSTTGNPIVSNSNTTSSGATTTTTAPLMPTSGNTDPDATKGTLEESTVTQLQGVPAKIFLFGKVKDDLQRAQALRVARTFSTLVVSFLTVEDPIQIRFQAWILDVNLTKARNVGVRWPDSLSYRALNGATQTAALAASTAVNPAAAGATSAGTIFSKMFSAGGAGSSPMQNITAGLNTNVDLAIQILETEQVSRIIQAPTILVTNGQHGYFNSGGQVPVLTTDSTATSVSQNITYQSYGVQLYVLPLNLERSGPGGFTEDILNQDGTKSIPTMMDTKALINPVGKNNFSVPPEIDESLKMVDENGNIGVRVNVTISDIDSTRAAVSGAPALITKTSYTRAVLKDMQPLVISGVYQKQFGESDRKVPFFGDIPLIGGLFKQKNVTNDDVREVVVVLKPTIVRFSQNPEREMPLQKTKEMVDLMHGFDPQVGNKSKGKNEPYKGNGVGSKAVPEAKLVSPNAPSVEQVPLIDVTPAAPKVEPIQEVPMTPRSESASEPAPVVPVTEAAPAPLQEEAPAPAVQPMESSTLPEAKTEGVDPNEPTRMKEGPKTRVRPEAPDDTGVLKDQPQTRIQLRNDQQEVHNRL